MKPLETLITCKCQAVKCDNHSKHLRKFLNQFYVFRQLQLIVGPVTDFHFHFTESSFCGFQKGVLKKIILLRPLYDCIYRKKYSKLPNYGHLAKRKVSGSDFQCQVSKILYQINRNNIMIMLVWNESIWNQREVL